MHFIIFGILESCYLFWLSQRVPSVNPLENNIGTWIGATLFSLVIWGFSGALARRLEKKS